jgi:hypothetical protein
VVVAAGSLDAARADAAVHAHDIESPLARDAISLAGMAGLSRIDAGRSAAVVDAPRDTWWWWRSAE